MLLSPAPADEICFPQISAFFPGHHLKAMSQNAEMRRLEAEVDALLASGHAAGAAAAAAAVADKAAGGSQGADTSADIEAMPGATLADKIAAAVAANK